MNEPSAMPPAAATISLEYSTQHPRRRWGRRPVIAALLLTVGFAVYLTQSHWWPPVKEAWSWHVACEKARVDVLAYRDSLNAENVAGRANCGHVVATLAALDPLRFTREVPRTDLRSEEPTSLSAPSLRHRTLAIASLVQLSRKYIEQWRFADAIAVVDAILALDPQSDYGLGVRPILVDRASLAQSRRGG